MNAKHFVAKLMPRFLVLEIKYFYQKIHRLIKHQRLFETFCPVNMLTKKRTHVFFGYYDIAPFNSKTDEIIYNYLIEKEGIIHIVLSSLSNLNKVIEIAESHAWNWQQGSRLRWMPNNHRCIAFNDFKDNYYARIINVETKEERCVNYPLYDISSDGKMGLSIDFERLQSKRPGYGYSCRVYDETFIDLRTEGIYLVNLEINTAEKIVTYSDISSIRGCESLDLRNNYINHLSFSPSGAKFLFFWLDAKTTPHKANLLVYDILKQTMTALECDLRVSHYVWEDDNHIIVTAYNHDNKCNYYRYSLSSGVRECLCPDKLNTDGHPSFLDENVILTDTYPDTKGFQKLYTVNLMTNERIDLLDIYSNCLYEGERRTDLHPRLNKTKDKVCIDENSQSNRSIMILTLNKS